MTAPLEAARTGGGTLGVRLTSLIEVLNDSTLSVEDRAGAYAILHAVQLRINRGLRLAKDDLIRHMVANDLRALGPLSVRWTGIDVRWPCNEPGNWHDDGVQEGLRILAADPATSDYVRRVPLHLEIDTVALGAAMAENVPAARELHAELRRRGWRTEEGRRASIVARESSGAVS